MTPDSSFAGDEPVAHPPQLSSLAITSGAISSAPLAANDMSIDGKTSGSGPLEAEAVVFSGKCEARIDRVALKEPGPDDVIIETLFSGVSTGTERLLWTGEMPAFPGLGYPLIPGYEAVGRVSDPGTHSELADKIVFVPGAACFEGARGLFGAAASRLVAPASRVIPIEFKNAETGALLALAATAQHAIEKGSPPDLIIGHGALGRLLARLTIASGAPTPVVWEVEPERFDGDAYPVIDPDDDGRTDYSSIYDVSGDSELIDRLVAHAAPGAEIVLAGFYAGRLSFNFAPAFIKEMRLRIAAEWRKEDLDTVVRLAHSGAISLDGLITHRCPANDTESAYHTAFSDPSCLKMILDWRTAA
ncbi:MAG: chlorophyll synthesis pathway protein BchC [Pseudomonadota bacterium]